MNGKREATEREAGVAPAERIFTLDVLRGFALIGISLINVQSLTGITAIYQHTTANDLVANFETFFVQGRFFPIFSFLFGVGFFIFMRNAERRGDRPRVLFARRLGVLLLFGIAHQFLQPGEALLPYAIFGFLLLPLYRVRSPFLLALSVPFFVLGLWVTDFLYVPALFMVGMICGRAGIFECPDEHVRGLRISALAFLTLSVAGLEFQWYVLQGNLQVSDNFSLSAMYAPGLPMAGLYAVVLTLLLRGRSMRNLLRPLAAYGRTALTNYIGATLLLIGGAYVLESVGVDVHEPVSGLLLCLALYSIQIPLSNWWLSRYRMGPLEWIWRALIYGRVPLLTKTRG